MSLLALDYDESYHKHFSGMARFVLEAFLEAGLTAIVAVLFIAFIIATIAGLLGFDYASSSPGRSKKKETSYENAPLLSWDKQPRLLLEMEILSEMLEQRRERAERLVRRTSLGIPHSSYY